jgi:zinc transporter ZupT
MEQILIYFLLFITIIISGSAIFLFKTDNPKVLKLILAFSGAFLLAISFLNLVPEVFSGGLNKAGIYILIGFVLQLLLELLTKGIEHGHGHVHECCEEHDHSVHFPKVAPIGLMIGICLHSFLEGMPLIQGMHNHDLEGIQHSLTIGIIIHNIPISFVLMSIFIQSGMSRKRAFGLLGIFALMTPAGSLLSSMLSHEFIHDFESYFSIIMGIVVGIFLHVSTSILFETSEDHQYNIKKFATVILGIAIALLIPMH